MSRARSAVPELLLGVTSLDLPARTTRDRVLEVSGRFREPESLAVTLVKALDAGAGGVYAVPSARLRAALRELRRPVPLLARLPLTPPGDDVHDAHPLLIDSAETAPGAAWGGVRASATALAMLPGALAGDLGPRVAARCEREAPALAARAWVGMAVAAPLTDLALAAGNARFFETLVRFGRSRFGGVAGFETHNLGRLLTMLETWGIEPDFVLGAMNPRGFAMKPDAATPLAAVGRGRVPVLACELRACGTVPLAEGAHFARLHGARGLVVDLVELDDVAAELRALRSADAAAD